MTVVYIERPRFRVRIIGLMVEYYPATVEIGVRFPDDAHSFFFSFFHFPFSDFRIFGISHFAFRILHFAFLAFVHL